MVAAKFRKWGYIRFLVGFLVTILVGFFGHRWW
jgi:hypothetical protein